MLLNSDEDFNPPEGAQRPCPHENEANEGDSCGCPPSNGAGKKGDDDHPGELSGESSPHLRIEPEGLDDQIHPGAGDKLYVPREDIDSDLDADDELDVASMMPKKIRKPGRREWIALSIASELPTRLLLHKEQPDAIEVHHYFVDRHLRGPIVDELKEVRVFVYYSFQTNTHGLLLLNVTIDNPWYESAQALLRQPAEFFAENAIRIIPDKKNSRYRVRRKPMPSSVAWPEQSTGELLGEALGPDRFITSADHPIYRDLIDGTELD